MKCWTQCNHNNNVSTQTIVFLCENVLLCRYLTRFIYVNKFFIKNIDHRIANSVCFPVSFLVPYSPHSEWLLVSAKQRHIERYYTCCKNAYSVISVEVILKRRSLFQIIHLIVPMMLVAILGLLLFTVPARSGKETVHHHKIPLNITMAKKVERQIDMFT